MKENLKTLSNSYSPTSIIDIVNNLIKDKNNK